MMKKFLCTFAFFAILHTTNAQQRDRDFPHGGFNIVAVGVTQIAPTGGLSNYFTSATGANIGMGLRIRRVFVGFQTNNAHIRLNTPLLSSTTGYNHDFQIGDSFDYWDSMGNIGYILIRNNWIELMPFVGLGGTRIRSNLYDGKRNRDEFIVVNSFTVSPGLRAEFPLVRGVFNERSSLNLRLDVGYNMPVKFRYTSARGNVFFARMGIALWFD